MTIWDDGTFKTLEEEDGKYVLLIAGKRLTGEYALVRTAMGGNRKNWLFFKRRQP